jgi:hypothetical protein
MLPREKGWECGFCPYDWLGAPPLTPGPSPRKTGERGEECCFIHQGAMTAIGGAENSKPVKCCQIIADFPAHYRDAQTDLADRRDQRRGET